MDKIKAKLNKVKEDIECCEERVSMARSGLVEAQARFDAAETEKASFKRRLNLLRQEVQKMKDAVKEKQERLDCLQSKTAEDEVVVKNLENQEVEGDEKLEHLNDMVKRGQMEAEDYDLQWREASRKLHVLNQDTEKTENRLEGALLRVEEAKEKLENLGKKIKSLEEKESDQCERETENEQKLVFLQDQEKQALTRAENAERDVVRLGRVAESIMIDIENWRNKREDIIAEINSVTSLADDI